MEFNPKQQSAVEVFKQRLAEKRSSCCDNTCPCLVRSAKNDAIKAGVDEKHLQELRLASNAEKRQKQKALAAPLPKIQALTEAEFAAELKQTSDSPDTSRNADA